MYFVSVHYKIYEWSKRATVLNVLGAILKAFCWICICAIIMSLVMIPTAVDPNYKSDLKFIIPIVLVSGIILAIIGSILQKKSEKISNIAFENKVKNDFNFVKRMSKKDSENKKWYMEKNSEYAEYVASGKEELEVDGESENVKKLSPTQLLITVVVVFVLIFGGFYLLEAFN